MNEQQMKYMYIGTYETTKTPTKTTIRGKIFKMDSNEQLTEEYTLTGEIEGKAINGMLKYGDDKILLYIGASNVPVYCYDINTKECNPITLTG